MKLYKVIPITEEPLELIIKYLGGGILSRNKYTTNGVLCESVLILAPIREVKSLGESDFDFSVIYGEKKRKHYALLEANEDNNILTVTLRYEP